jgi:8-oxo-dGTP pyrophosphatase MutT (NUDIX family)
MTDEHNDERTELLDVYDADGRRTGRTIRRGEPLGEGEYRFCAEVWIVNTRREVLIEKRAAVKKLAGIWALVTGAVSAGETTREAAAREVLEEVGIGLRLDELDHLMRTVYGDMLWDIFLARRDFDLSETTPQPGEVDEIRWASTDEIRRMVAEKKFFEYPEIHEILARIDGMEERT